MKERTRSLSEEKKNNCLTESRSFMKMAVIAVIAYFQFVRSIRGDKGARPVECV